MPIGFYECQNCGEQIEAFIAENKCPKCGSANLEYWDISTYCEEHPENNKTDEYARLSILIPLFDLRSQYKKYNVSSDELMRFRRVQERLPAYALKILGKSNHADFLLDLFDIRKAVEAYNKASDQMESYQSIFRTEDEDLKALDNDVIKLIMLLFGCTTKDQIKQKLSEFNEKAKEAWLEFKSECRERLERSDGELKTRLKKIFEKVEITESLMKNHRFGYFLLYYEIERFKYIIKQIEV